MSNSQRVISQGMGTGLGGLAMHMSSDLAPSTGQAPAGSSEGPRSGTVDSATAKAFLKGANQTVKGISQLLRELCQTQNLSKREDLTLDFQRQLNELKGLFGSAKMEVLTSFVACLNRLVGSLRDTQKPLNPSVLRTVTNAVDFLRQAVDVGCDCRQVESSPLRLMVVDDDAVCRRAMALALTSGDLKLAVCENGVKALEMLREENFDAIFLDIMMPGINGLVVARTIRELPTNSDTPIVFVTCLSDFKTRSESILSGGCDLVGKPVSPSEILVKAYTLALRKRFSRGELGGIAPKNATTHISKAQTVTTVPTCVGVLHVRQDGVIDSFDQDCSRLLGYTLSEMRGQHINLLFPDGLQSHADAVNKLLTSPLDRPVQMTICARRSDGSTAFLEATISAFFANKNSRMLFLKAAKDDRAAPSPAPVAPRAVEAPVTCQPALAPPPSSHARHPEPHEDLSGTVAGLQEKLRSSSKLLAEYQAKLRLEQDCRVALEARVKTTPAESPTPVDLNTELIQKLQTEIFIARRELQSEREKRQQLEAKLQELLGPELAKA